MQNRAIASSTVFQSPIGYEYRDREITVGDEVAFAHVVLAIRREKLMTTVLAIGASGRFAGLVVPELARRRVTVRAFLRDPATGRAARARATEIAIGDLRDTASLRAALAGRRWRLPYRAGVR